MATVRNIASNARLIPAAGDRIVPPGEDFEVDDDLFDELEWNPDLFKVVHPPAGRRAPRSAADRSAAAKKAAETRKANAEKAAAEAAAQAANDPKPDPSEED